MRVVARHIGQELGDIRIHDVVGEVVLNPPHRLIAQIRAFFGEGHVFLVNLVICYGLIGVLEYRSMSDVHGC